MKTRLDPMTVRLALLGLVPGLAACPARHAYQEELAAAPAGAQHAVHTERLQEVMRGLDRLDRERLPQGVDLDAARGPRLAELVEVAEAIAASAEQIPQATWSDGSLTGPERAAFHRRAALLRERALTLAREAKAMSPGERAQAVSDLHDACQGCHAEFRRPRDPESDVPGSDGP